MMKTTVVYYIVLTVLSMTLSCSCNNRVKVMDEAENIVSVSPDSSLVLLSAIDKYKLSKEERARYGLLFTMAQDKSGLDVDMDTLIRSSYIYYKGKPETKYYGLSQYYMGKYYMLNDSTKECEMCFKNVINNARERGDIDLQCLALEKLSRSVAISNSKQSVAYARQNLELYKTSKTRKLENTIYYTLNLARSFIMDDQKDSALTYMRQAKGLLNDKLDKSVISDVYHSLCGAYYCFDTPDSALYYSRKALEIMQNDKLLIFHAFCLQKNDSLEAAEKILRDCVKRCSNQQKYTIYMDICRMSGKRLADKQHSDDIDSLNKYTGMYMMDLYSFKGKYFEESIRQGRELERQETAVLMRNYTILFIAVCVILIAGIAIHSYNRQQQKIENNVQLAEQLQRMLSSREAEYSEAHNSIKILLSSKYEVFDELCRLAGENSNPENTRKRISAAVTSLIKQMTGDNKMILDLENFVNSHCSNLMADLRADIPDMVENYYRLFLFSVLGFSDSSIAMFLQKEKVSQIYNIRRHLKDKIRNLEEPKRSWYLGFL